ncbi:MAG: hypothetical protein MZV64_17520 [Ignavibacteriales bacterium]|nr:hypothetical protein [Ignavibacteriales bacterium]
MGVALRDVYDAGNLPADHDRGADQRADPAHARNGVPADGLCGVSGMETGLLGSRGSSAEWGH